MPVCVFEVKTCSDGTKVSRTGNTCDFARCPDEKEVIAEKTSDSIIESTPVSTSSQTVVTTTDIVISTSSPTPSVIPIPKKSVVSTIISTVSSAVSSVISTVTSIASPAPQTQSYTPTSSADIPASSYITNTNNPSALPPSDFAGQKYIVDNGNILSNDNKVVYTIPQSVIEEVSSSSPGWTNTIINVIPVGNVAPILNAIPIADLPGKYYLSENSFGNKEACEFSNKIFILDTVANTATLMYEENNTTLAHDDPRACTSEIFLLATEASKLILKYHTIGTNTLCDSAWSEPEKTFFLDVVKLRTDGMMKYSIPESLSSGAEQEEEACRSKLQ